jgi:septum formation protein
MKIYLASGSPRRKELLGWMGLEFEVRGHGFDEGSVRMDSLKELAGELALRKAGAAAERVKSGLVIGADLIVDLKGKQLGKPKDLKEAKKMLRALRDKTHRIYTGLAVIKTEADESVMSVAEAKVKMKNYSDEIIEKYVKSFKVLDKGGSYSIKYQLPDYGSLIKKHEGALTTILGLPLHYLETLLLEFKVKPKKDWQKKCKVETGYEY